MTYLLDTSFISLLRYRHAVSEANVASHSGDTLVISTTTVEESILGCLDLMRRARTNRDLAIASDFLAIVATQLGTFGVVGPSEAAWDRFDALVRLKLNVGKNDLRIAALALDINATVVTANVRDFARVPGLSWVDWSQ